MIKNFLPKSPIAAAGVGILFGAGIGGIKGWLGVRRGEATQKEAVAGAIKQGLLFGGVAAVSTLASGSKGGGAGLATMAVMGLSGGGSGLSTMFMGMAGGGRGGGMGGMRGGMSSGSMGKMGGGQGGQGGTGSGGSSQPSGSMLDTVSNTIADMIMPNQKATILPAAPVVSEPDVPETSVVKVTDSILQVASAELEEDGDEAGFENDSISEEKVVESEPREMKVATEELPQRDPQKS